LSPRWSPIAVAGWRDCRPDGKKVPGGRKKGGHNAPFVPLEEREHVAYERECLRKWRRMELSLRDERKARGAVKSGARPPTRRGAKRDGRGRAILDRRGVGEDIARDSRRDRRVAAKEENHSRGSTRQNARVLCPLCLR
jgi:hypothetical protein